MQFSSLVERIGGTTVTAWDLHFQSLAALQRGEDVIPLTSGDPDLPSPSAAVEAAVVALEAGDTHYTELAGRPKLREAIAREHHRLSGQVVGPEHVIFLAGAQNALTTAALCLLGPGDQVIVPQPMYLTYQATLSLAGATLVPVPQPAALDFRLDLAALARAITPETRAIFLATPNNPTGVVMSAEELAEVARLAIAHDLWVVADEVYAALTYERPHVSIAALPGMAERTVTVSSLSKSHAMTGWRAGWLVGPEALIGHATNLALSMFYGLPGFIQAGALAALANSEETQAELRAIYRARRDLILDRLSSVVGLRCFKPEAGMFMLVDVSATGLTPAEFAWGLYRATGVAVLDAAPFGRSAAGCIRVSFAGNEDRLTEACWRIQRFTAKLRPRARA